MDTRLLSIEELKSLLVISQLRGAKLEIVDIEGSIWNSILSVFNRDPFGNDPCVPFAVIKDGFIRARASRENFIHESQRENVFYSLYRTEEDGRFTLVAKTQDKQFSCMDEKAFKECLEVPCEEDIDAIGKMTITHDLINSLKCPRKEVLEQWLVQNCTIEQALEMHSQGMKPGPLQ